MGGGAEAGRRASARDAVPSPGWVGGCDEWCMAGCPPTSKIRQGGEKNRRKVSHLAASYSVTAEGVEGAGWGGGGVEILNLRLLLRQGGERSEQTWPWQAATGPSPKAPQDGTGRARPCRDSRTSCSATETIGGGGGGEQEWGGVTASVCPSQGVRCRGGLRIAIRGGSLGEIEAGGSRSCPPPTP